MRRFFKRVASLFGAVRAENELEREIESHLGILQDNFEKSGLSPAKAKLAARRSYGNVESVKELHRETRSYMWVENLVRDVGYGWRSLSHTPGFTCVAAIALALGIGANTAIFGVVNAVVLQPLAYRDSDRLVTILHNGTGPVATANYMDWRDQSHAFETMGAADYWSPNISGDDRSDSRPAEHLFGLKVTQNMLPMLGVQPLLGRLFAKGEDREGSKHEVVLSYALWQRRFNGEPSGFFFERCIRRTGSSMSNKRWPVPALCFATWAATPIALPSAITGSFPLTTFLAESLPNNANDYTRSFAIEGVLSGIADNSLGSLPVLGTLLMLEARQG